jgi:hypothetical protein
VDPILKFCLCVSSLVTRFVEDKHEGLLLCHESVAAIDDMCSVHSFCTRLWNTCPGLMISKRTAAVSQKIGFLITRPSHPHQQFTDSPQYIHSADDSDQSRLNVEMRVEVEKSRN